MLFLMSSPCYLFPSSLLSFFSHFFYLYHHQHHLFISSLPPYFSHSIYSLFLTFNLPLLSSLIPFLSYPNFIFLHLHIHFSLLLTLSFLLPFLPSFSPFHSDFISSCVCHYEFGHIRFRGSVRYGRPAKRCW